MSKPNSNSDTEVTDTENVGLPEQSAPSVGSIPVSDGKEEEPQGSSWDEENAKLISGDAEEPQEQRDSELRLLKLEKELEQERKLRETAEKRQKDSQRAFRDRSEELARLKKEREEEPQAKTKPPEKEPEPAASEEIAPLTEIELDELQKKNGWTEAEREEYEIYPERWTSVQKAIDQGVSAKIAEELAKREEAKERKAAQDRMTAEEKTQHEEGYATLMNGIKAVHPDADTILESPEFASWAQANAALKDSILNRKQRYDPTGGIEVLDHYKDHEARRREVVERAEFNRRSMSRPESMGGTRKGPSSERTWDQINADLKKAHS